jgi:capsular polysaccharide biosynthesis protein
MLALEVPVLSTLLSSRRRAGEHPDLRAVAQVARRGWWALAVATLLAAVAAQLAGSRGPDRYEASARVLVGPVSGNLAALRAAGERAPTYADLATSGRVIAAARARAGLSASTQRLRHAVKAEAEGTSRLISITGEAGTPRAAARLANAVAAEIGPAIYRDPRVVAREFHVVDAAVPPRAPVSSHLRALVVFAALAGFLACFTVLLVVDYFRGRVATAEDLAELSSTTLLGVLDGRTPREGYDVLAARIRLARSGTMIRSILIAGDGAQQTADRLAAALDRAGTPVVRLAAPERGTRGDLRRAARGLRERPIVLLAAPAPDRSAVALYWTRLVDRTILVARGGHTSRDSVARSAAALRQVGGELLGSVLSVSGGVRLGSRVAAARRMVRRPAPPAGATEPT